MNKISIEGLDDDGIDEIFDTLKQRVKEGAVLLDFGKYSEMLPTVVIRIDRTHSSIDVIKEEGMPLGMLEKATFRIAREVQRVRSQKRYELKKDDYQKGLETPVVTEGEEMTTAYAESKLPPPSSLDKPATSQS